MRWKIFIDGQEGTTGLKIRKRLQERNDLELLLIGEEERKDPEARLEKMRQADVSFLCLPDAASREIAERAEAGMRILDTSTAHRTDPGWVYGLPELDGIQKDRIRDAGRVSVPGCHATGFISLVKPLISMGVIPREYPLICHSLTGYSGGGKSMIAQYQGEGKDAGLESPRQYALDQNHKHLPEMTVMTGISIPPAFHPIVADYYCGMLVTVTLHRRLLRQSVTPSGIRQILTDYYKDGPVIKVRAAEEMPADGFMAANALGDTDGLEIHVLGNEAQISLMARYDNLGKGASGAAIQCMNLMLGLPQEAGLIL